VSVAWYRSLSFRYTARECDEQTDRHAVTYTALCPYTLPLKPQ